MSVERSTCAECVEAKTPNTQTGFTTIIFAILRYGLCAGIFLAAIILPAAAVTADRCAEPQGLAEAIQRFESRCFEVTRSFLASLPDSRSSAEALYYLGRAALEMGDSKVALKLLKSATKLEAGKTNADAHYWLAIAAFDALKGRWPFEKLRLANLARDSLREAIRLRNDFSRARYNLAYYYLRRGKDDASHSESEVLKGLDNALYSRFLARRNENEGRTNDAIMEYRASISASPDLGTYINFVDLYQSQESWKEAFALLDDAIKTTGDGRCFLFLLGETSALSEQRLDKAVDALVSFIEGGDPYCQRRDWSTDAHWRLGQIYEQLTNFESAMEQYQIVAAVEPKNRDEKKIVKRAKKDLKKLKRSLK